MNQVIIVVPCYNEARRLDRQTFQAFTCNEHEIRFLFVDDGSSDETAVLLETLRESNPSRFAVLSLTENQGKAEAVRRGFLKAFESNPKYVGFWDADLATPLAAIPTFLEILDKQPDVEIVFGARVKLLGRHIERRAVRHYLGRLFATAVSVALGIGVYDTQCGAKVFRMSPFMKDLFDQRFISRWIFDVEIIARFIQRRTRVHQIFDVGKVIHEIPLMEWRDVRGSKLRAVDFLMATFDIIRIYHHYIRFPEKLRLRAPLATESGADERRK